MNRSLRDDGYIVIHDVFSREEISKMRESCLRYFSNDGGFNNSGGMAKPDWIKEASLKEVLDIYESKNIGGIISKLVGESVEFIGHNDLHLNRSVGWHKDQLNGEARRFQINSPWETVGGESMKIFKANLYLQSHSENSDGLTVRKGSHKYPEMLKGIVKQINPKEGDLVLFDQRISHRANWSGGYDRLLICMGFGVNNCFFEQFKKGTEFRQNSQNGEI